MSRFRFTRREWLLCAAVANLAALGVGIVVVWARRDPYRDVLAYHQLVQRLRAGGPMYLPMPLGPHSNSQPVYIYPPFFAAALRFLAPLSFQAFARAWLLLGTAAFVGYAALLARLATRRWTIADTLIALLVLTYWPGAFYALVIGQVDPLLWISIALAVLYVRGRGAALMAVALVKPYTLPALALAFLRERGRVLEGALITCLGGMALGAASLGTEPFVRTCLTWLTEVLPTLGQGAWAPYNYSISFAPLRIARAAGWLDGHGTLPSVARMYLTIMSFGGPLVVGWLLRRRSARMQTAATVASAVLLSPVCWSSYLAVLLVPAAVLMGERRSPHRRTSQPAMDRAVEDATGPLVGRVNATGDGLTSL